MKKTIYTFAILTSVLFASCNNKLNDDIDDLEGSFSELQAENAALQTELDNVSGNLVDGGIDAVSPLQAIHEYTSDGDIISETATFLSFNGYYYEYTNNVLADISKSESLAKVEAISVAQTYTHYVEIDAYSLDNGYIRLNFEYNSDTQETELDSFRYDVDNAYYSIYSGSSNVEQTLTINSFDTTTGEISLDFEMEYDEGYSNGAKVSFSINETLSDDNNSNIK